jgi:hypothetical protein
MKNALAPDLTMCEILFALKSNLEMQHFLRSRDICGAHLAASFSGEMQVAPRHSFEEGAAQ